MRQAKTLPEHLMRRRQHQQHPILVKAMKQKFLRITSRHSQSVPMRVSLFSVLDLTAIESNKDSVWVTFA
jgi:hypothetical protein